MRELKIVPTEHSMPTIPDDLIPLPVAAELIQVDSSTIRRWILNEKVQGYRRVGRWLISKADLLALIKPEIIVHLPTKKEMAARERQTDKVLREAGIRR
jgi:hypothetical protein